MLDKTFTKEEYVLIKHPKTLDEIGYARIKIVENYQFNEDSSIAQSKIELRLKILKMNKQPFYEQQGEDFFSGSYNQTRRSVQITSGFVILEKIPKKLRGCRIGTLLMDKVISWAKQWPEANVNTIELLAHDGGEDNKARRNKFYENFGITFEYTSNDKKAGLSKDMKAQELVNHNSWEQNIEMIPSDKLVSFLFKKENDLMRKIEGLQHTTEYFKGRIRQAEDTPIRFIMPIIMWKIFKHLYRAKELVAIITMIGIIAASYYLA